MKKIAILTTFVILISQITVFGAVADPVFQYNLYSGDKTDLQANNGDLIGTESYTFDFPDRFGGNTAIRLSSNDTEIRIPREAISNLTGDFFIGCWAQIDFVEDAYQTLLSLDRESDYSLLFNIYTDFGDINVNGYLQDDVFIAGDLNSKYMNTWTHWGIEYNSNTRVVTFYLNGKFWRERRQSFFDLSLIHTDGYLGRYKFGNIMENGSISEFVLYNTLFNLEYNLNEDCPVETVQWNVGSDTSRRVCIHNACSQNIPSVLSYIQNNLTISANTSGLVWEDSVNIDYTLSYNDCGDSNTTECFYDKCFEHTILLADDSDYNLTSLPASVDLLKPSEPGFSFADYHNSTKCTQTNNSSTCHFIMPIFFKELATNTTFSRDISLIELEFTVEFNQVPGEDTMTAELTNQQFSTASHQISSDVDANIESTAQVLSGATLDFDGTPPTTISLRDSIDLELLAPAGYQERDFKNGTLDVELVFDSNGTEVVFPIVPSATTFVNQGNSTAGALRSVQFTIQANYLGTYTIRAGATLVSEARRLLQEVETESSNIKTQLQITVTNPEKPYSYLQFMLIIIVALLFVLQYYVQKSKQLSKQQQPSKYENVDLKTIA